MRYESGIIYRHRWLVGEFHNKLSLGSKRIQLPLVGKEPVLSFPASGINLSFCESIS